MAKFSGKDPIWGLETPIDYTLGVGINKPY